MIHYDRNKPLIFIHIPKCGGTSLVNIFRDWFENRCYRHYYRKHEGLMPEKYPLKEGICIYGHFNRKRGFGVEDYYPEVDQFVTFLRDPLEMAKSNYFYWKKILRSLKIELGTLKEGDHFDFRDIQDFFSKRPRSHLLNFLPQDINEKNFKEILEQKFIYIGITEDLENSVNRMAQCLDCPQAAISHLNKSQRDEELPLEMEEKFKAENKLEYLVYNYVKLRYNSDAK